MADASMVERVVRGGLVKKCRARIHATSVPTCSKKFVLLREGLAWPFLLVFFEVCALPAATKKKPREKPGPWPCIIMLPHGSLTTVDRSGDERGVLCILLVGHMRTFRRAAPTLAHIHARRRLFVSTYREIGHSSFQWRESAVGLAERRRRGTAHGGTDYGMSEVVREADVQREYGEDAIVQFTDFDGYSRPANASFGRGSNGSHAGLEHNFTAQHAKVRAAVHWMSAMLHGHHQRTHRPGGQQGPHAAGGDDVWASVARQCDAVLLSRPDVAILQDVRLLGRNAVRVGNASYNLHEAVVFATHRASRCDAKVADWFVLMGARDLRLLGAPPDAACDFPADEPPPPERELMRTLLIEHARSTFYADGAAAIARRFGLERCTCPPCSQSRLFSLRGFACGALSGPPRACPLVLPRLRWTESFGARLSQLLASGRCDVLELRLASYANHSWAIDARTLWNATHRAVRPAASRWDWELVALRMHSSLLRLARPPSVGLPADLRVRLKDMFPECIDVPRGFKVPPILRLPQYRWRDRCLRVPTVRGG